MDQLIAEIHAAVKGRAWVLALTGTLALPDICAAVEQPSATSTGGRYRDWCKRYLIGAYPTLDPSDCYKLRCNMMHTALSSTHNLRVMFFADSPVRFHMCTVDDKILLLDLETFCNDMILAVRRWQKDKASDPVYQANYANLIRWHPNGMESLADGIPILG